MLTVIGSILVWLLGTNLNPTPYRVLVMDEINGESTNPVVVNYYPDSGKVLMISLPAELTVEASKGYGLYKLGSLENLANQEKKGLELVRQSYTKSLGLHIDKVMVIDSIPYTKEKLDGQKLLTQTGIKISLPLWWKFRNIPKTSLKLVEFKASDLGEETTNVDGTPIYILNELKSDTKIFRLQQEYLNPEAPSLTIENSTKIGGLAQETKRVLAQEGWNIVRLSDGIEELPYTIILLGQENLMETPLVKDLALIFPGSVTRVENTERYRSEVVIKLGFKGRGFWD